MESLKAVFFGPDPQAQMRKCNALIRTNTRQLDRDLARLKASDSLTRQHIVNASKRAQRNPSQAKQANNDTKVFARELVRIRKQTTRLNTSRAQLQSVGMQVNEAFSARKIQGSLQKSTGIMKDVNTLVRLPQLSATMHQLSSELVRAGIIEEMVDDATMDPSVFEDEEDEAESEIEKILQEILPGKLAQAQPVTAPPVANIPEPESPQAEEFEDQEATLAQMRGRLEALKS
ncbi:Snf7 [Penicillium italicum]|uniref:Snf7 n=1 Tax=Penicillium italicum TaxID=40296 RepID=A0A0A2LFR2_PENIT|nr:Snf7 [Penicillium italicum]